MKYLVLILSLVFLVSCSLTVQTVNTSRHIASDKKHVTFTKYLDEQKHIWLSSVFNIEDGSFRMTLLHQQDVGFNSFELPLGVIRDGIEIEVDGKRVYGKAKEIRAGIQEFDVFIFEGDFSMNEDSVVKYKLYGEDIAEYIFDPKQKKIIPSIKERMLSAFDMRQFYIQGKPYIDRWKRDGATIAQGELATKIDLHTHYGGAMRAETIIEIADELSLEYPVELLKKNNIYFNPSAVYEEDGKEFIKLEKYNYDDRKFKALLSINVEETISFEQMEEIYQLRGPLVKNKRAFKRFLEEIAKDYSKMGVVYSELSISDIVKPDWLEEAKEVLPEIKKKTGVDLRFLVGLWRHYDDEYNSEMIDKVTKLIDEKIIVGIDVMGFESNPTEDQKLAIKRAAKLRETVRSDFQIRVHAGENAMNLRNVKEAIRLGATRIGHGVYGIDDETMSLARENDVIIELNMNSNLALENINTQDTIPAKRYIDSGVRVTLGTDGHGLYNTSSQAELAVLKSLGFTEEEINKVRASDSRYLKLMEGGKSKSLSCPELLMRILQ